jgi:hypothetical protein
MVLVNAKPVLPVMMHQDAVSPLLSEDLRCKASWSAWTTRKLILVTKLKPREVSSTLNIPLKTVLSTTGTIWKESGIMPSSTN